MSSSSSGYQVSPPVLLEQVMQSDRYRLGKAWQRLSEEARKCADSPQHVKWRSKVEASATLSKKRGDSIPELKYDSELPISDHREELIGLIRSRQVIIVCGETGSGKSTQLPKICLEAGLGRTGFIGHTQPRRLAARAVASRLADELNSTVGGLVGYKIRFSDSTNPETLVKLMTDGVLLAETQSDRFLDQYDAIIIDEAHERSLNIDFLLGYLRRILAKRPELRVIITSATIDPERFAEHFADEHGPAPIVEVSGRTYPVEQRYRPPEELTETGEVDEEMHLKAIADAADELTSEGHGDILVFLPTERDIRVTAKHLRGHFTRIGGAKSVEILPLYARLSNAEQNKIFQSHSGRRIVLSTNVAESSLTVPGIHFVIDTGLARISRYAPRSKVQRLPIEAVSQASANQRSGRCGRLGPGVCIRLYSEDDYNSRSRFTTPEIRRSDLSSVLLQSYMLRLGPLEEFPLIDPPSSEALKDADRTLKELGAIDFRGKFTSVGRQLGQLPCDPRVGRMLLEAHERNCLGDMIIIAAGMESQDVRQRPAGQRDQADEAHRMFKDPHSDFLSLLRLWDFHDNLRSQLGRSRLQRALNQKFLSYQGFREWADIVRQLKDLLAGAGIRPGKRVVKLAAIDLEALDREEEEQRDAKRGKKPGPPIPKLARPEGYDAVHQSLLAGLLSGVAQRGDRHEYKAAGGIGISLWPGSGLFRRSPKWIIAGEILETNRRYARNVAELEVEWVEKAAEQLLKHNYSDPHWSSKAGAAMVYRRSTLYGLTVVSGRREPLAPIDPATARTMMIENGLVAGEWKCREAFYEHNQELIADIQELVNRTRSREFIVDRYHLANFYTANIPEEIYDLNTLRGWINKHRGQPEEKALWMTAEDLLAENEKLHSFGEAYPNQVAIGATEFPLEYRFEPGHDADGVTITVPQAALRQVSDESLGWLVPGLMHEKILAVIKSLPKSLRTNFVPAPDVAKKLTKQLEALPRDKPFSQALCEVMNEHSGERITRANLDLKKLPEHLHFLVRVVDDDGQEIAVGRDVSALVAEHAPQSTPGGPILSNEKESTWEDIRITPQDFDGIPDTITMRRGGVLVAAFPALFDLGDRVEIRLAETEHEANERNRQGMVRLMAIKHHRSLRSQVAHLPNLSQAGMKLSHLVSSKDLSKALQDLIVRVALVDGQKTVKDQIDFEARNAQATMQISVATQDISAWLPKLAEQAHQLRLSLEAAPRIWSEVVDDIKQQLDQMFAPGFLLDIPWEWLSEYPRYLQAANKRLDKLKNGGVAKDRKISEPIDQAWRKYGQAMEENDNADILRNERLEHLRWMIEEFRVSVYAQQLGTKHSVSPKRINEIVDSIGN